MNEERMNPNFNLESCLRNKVNEAKRYLEDKHKRQKDEPCEESSYAESFIYYFQNVETLLELYKQEKEKNSKIQKYVRSNEWTEDYEKSSCRTKILRILEE